MSTTSRYDGQTGAIATDIGESMHVVILQASHAKGDNSADIQHGLSFLIS